MYQVRNAQKDDLAVIEKIYAYAREFMAKNGNPNQWGDTHPLTSQLEDDIRRGDLYVVEDNSGIHGVFAFILGEDPTYGYIDNGAWRYCEPYGTIHRIASDGNGGIFPVALDFCESKIKHIRIDTHRDNKPMQHVVEKYGFQPCGTIYVADGSPRIAYDRK